MFSGKTSLLIQRCERYKHAKKNVIVVKYAGDTRYTEKSEICTHAGMKIPAYSCSRLSDLKIPTDIDVICIDEIQFYPDNIEFCDNMANSGIIVEVAGLDSNYKRDTFSRMGEFLGRADIIEKLTAMCGVCFRDGATFTARITDEEGEEVIGGAETYKAVCRKCHRRLCDEKRDDH